MQRPCEVTLQPIDCPRYLMALTSRRRHLAQARTLVAHEQTVKKLALDDRRKDRDILVVILKRLLDGLISYSYLLSASPYQTLFRWATHLSKISDD